MTEKQEDETYSTIFGALKHPIRRKILRMLNVEQLTYTQMMTELDLDSGHLNYYLDSLGELVLKDDEGRYRLSNMGQAAIGLMGKVEESSSDKKEIAQIKHSKRRAILLLQTFAIVMLLVSSLIFFNVTFESSFAGTSTLNPPGGYIIQPNGILVETDFVNIKNIHQNSSIVNNRYFYRIEIITNSTLWVQVIGGSVDNEVQSLENVRPESTLLYNKTVYGPLGPLSKTQYEILVSYPNRDLGINDGYNNGFLIQLRIANLGQQTIKGDILSNNTAAIDLWRDDPFIQRSEYRYFYVGVAFLLLVPVAIVLPYVPIIKKIIISINQ
jgi:hypothetical protein